MTDPMPDIKREKFYFNVNIFDEKEEPTEPPPPMFSEGELASARQQGFAQGKQEGIQETQDSIAKHTAKILEKISQDVQILFTAETEREKRYEREAVTLTLAIFQKLFPIYKEKFGFEELKGELESILRKQEGQKQITVHVAPAAVESLKAHIANSKSNVNFLVEGDETLGIGACRLAWVDGGAVRDSDAMAAQVETVLKDLLAVKAAKVHD